MPNHACYNQPLAYIKEIMTTTPIEFPDQIDFVQFVSNYAHDLRSPFNRMMGFLKIVLKGQDGPLTDLQLEDLNTVYQNSVYAFTQVSNLIDISRLIGGEKSLNLAVTSLSDVFQQAITQWQKYHSDLAVEFGTHPEAESVLVYVDSMLLSQAVAGLIACVVEFVKPPVQIALVVEEEAGGLLVTVRSTGRLAANPSKLDIEAYGYISQALIALHGGEFRRREAGDEGAVIQFTLPVK
jgi:K+-sensing histidine kinase KdpD